MARDYELGMIVNPDVGDEQARAIVDRITQTATANGGQVVRINTIGRRSLAYPIERHRDGLYFYCDLMLDPAAVSELERNIRVTEDIIRHLLLVRDPRAVAAQREREAAADELARQQQAKAAADAELAAAAAAFAANNAVAAEQETVVADETAASTEPSETEAGSETGPVDEVAEV